MHLIEKDKIIDENVRYIYYKEGRKIFRAKKKVSHTPYTGGYARRRKVNVHSHTIVEVDSKGKVRK